MWRVGVAARGLGAVGGFVNRGPQKSGRDYELWGRELHFSRPLAQEGRLGPVRWLSIFLGIAGTYRKNDSVDVVYEAGGRRTVASALPIIPPEARARGPGP